MMKCERCRRIVYEDAPLTAEARAHLAGCPDCAALAAEAVGLQDALRDVRVTVDPGYQQFRMQLILQKLASAPTPRPIWLPKVAKASLLIAAALAIMALLLIPFFHQPHTTVTHHRTPALHQPSHGRAPDMQVPFELQKIDSVVKLTWKGSSAAEYRIYKGATPAAMKPVQLVRGRLEWVDPSRDSLPIVFYRVEAL